MMSHDDPANDPAVPPAPPPVPGARASTWYRWIDSRRLRTVDDQFFVRFERDHRDTQQAWHRRRVVALITVVVGAVALAATLRMDRDSPWFPLAALGVAAIWAIGSFTGGRLHLGSIVVDGQVQRPILQPIIAGVALAGIFIGGAYATRLIPPLADEARSVLGFAQSGSLALITITTLLSGIAEELFFRGALYAAVREGRQILVTTLAYTLATALTGNPMLALAAAILGVVTGLQRRATGGVLAPILTHVTWSMLMLHVLPRIY